MSVWTEVFMDTIDVTTVADGTLLIPAKEPGVVLVDANNDNENRQWVPMRAAGLDELQMVAGTGYVFFPSSSTFRTFPLEA